MYFSPGATDYIDEIAPLIGRYAGRFETLAKAPVAAPSDVERFAAQMRSQGRSLVIGTVYESVADELARKAAPAISAPMLLFTPPPVPLKARIAATLVVDAVRAGASSPDGIRDQIQKNPIYGKASRTLELDWTVVGLGIGREDMRAFGGGLSDVRPCSCSSRDGRVSKVTNCRSNERCSEVQDRDTCEVSCVEERR